MTVSYVVSGFAVGLLVGLTGVGGGSLMTPLLTLLFGIHPSVAVGTDLAFASPPRPPAPWPIASRARYAGMWCAACLTAPCPLHS
jgi:hypothetical protein